MAGLREIRTTVKHNSMPGLMPPSPLVRPGTGGSGTRYEFCLVLCLFHQSLYWCLRMYPH